MKYEVGSLVVEAMCHKQTDDGRVVYITSGVKVGRH